MSQVLDQKEHAVIIGQAKVDQVTKMLQSAAAAADSALVRPQLNLTTPRRSDVDFFRGSTGSSAKNHISISALSQSQLYPEI